MTRPAGPVDYKSVQQAYDTVADDYAARLPDTRAEAALDLAMLDHFAATVGTGGGPVLDAGCGAGRMTRYLADRGCSVEGLDLSPAVVVAARRDHPDLTFAVGSIADLSYPDSRFVGVRCSGTPPSTLRPNTSAASSPRWPACCALEATSCSPFSPATARATSPRPTAASVTTSSSSAT